MYAVTTSRACDVHYEPYSPFGGGVAVREGSFLHSKRRCHAVPPDPVYSPCMQGITKRQSHFLYKKLKTT